MMPLMLSKPLKVLVVGAGKAGVIKAKTALRYQSSVVVMSLDFSSECQQLPVQQWQQDVYLCQLADFQRFDLIYFAQSWPEAPTQQQWLQTLINELIAQGKLVCVSCQPALGNVVNPCSRSVGRYVLALTDLTINPKLTKTRTELLAQTLAQAL